MNMSPLMTGKTFGIVFHYTDGTMYQIGSWIVPHDSEYRSLDRVGEDIGWTIVYEMAKQTSRTVARVEIVPWPVADDGTSP